MKDNEPSHISVLVAFAAIIIVSVTATVVLALYGHPIIAVIVLLIGCSVRIRVGQDKE